MQHLPCRFLLLFIRPASRPLALMRASLLHQFVILARAQLFLLHQRQQHVQFPQCPQHPQQRIEGSNLPFLDLLHRRKRYPRLLRQGLLRDILFQTNRLQPFPPAINESTTFLISICFIHHILIMYSTYIFKQCLESTEYNRRFLFNNTIVVSIVKSCYTMTIIVNK